MIKALYTDGGVCLKNPSQYGVSWAFVAVDENDTEVARGSNRITTPDCGRYKASNNLAEMIAAVRALEYAADNAVGVRIADTITLFSDSELTLNRLFRRYSTRLLPNNVVTRGEAALSTLGKAGILVEPVLLAGHPTKKNLADGFKLKKGKSYPVSKWNVLVDGLCTEEAAKLAPVKT